MSAHKKTPPTDSPISSPVSQPTGAVVSGVTKPSAAASKAAFEALKSRLLALPRDRVKATRPDMGDAVSFTLGIAGKVKEAALHARFASLPAQEFKLADVDDLEPLSLCAWYCHLQLQTAMATTTEAKVDPKVIASATAVKKRMMKVVEHNLDSAAALLEISSIRQGTGHKDLAEDLGRLARLYETYVAEIEHDRKHYQTGDVTEAYRLSAQIMDQLGATATREHPQEQDLAARAWTVLLAAYEEVAAAGRFLLRKEGGDDIFRSLIGAARDLAPVRAKTVADKPAALTGPTAPPHAVPLSEAPPADAPAPKKS